MNSVSPPPLVAVAAQRQRVRRRPARREPRQEVRLPAPGVAVAAVDEQQRRLAGRARRKARADFEFVRRCEHSRGFSETGGRRLRRRRGLAVSLRSGRAGTRLSCAAAVPVDERGHRPPPLPASFAVSTHPDPTHAIVARRPIVPEDHTLPPPQLTTRPAAAACASRRSSTTCMPRTRHYWCRPVPPFGDRRRRLVIVGLAPGMHGANATRPAVHRRPRRNPALRDAACVRLRQSARSRPRATMACGSSAAASPTR